ncbi:cytosolic regulator pianissimo [Rhizodiscina lignyota]|uniref:Cytosolic regulator pianissimo n=1 Tax=Rhizodiscina lignyota TaxID=1504668 RepID=A0A9P4IBV8_9PEZI|nr:cytosolic regulator pianissimo [Rhizodiscina lignyota]
MSVQVDTPSTVESQNTLVPPSRRDGRALSATNIPFPPRGTSYGASGPPPGSFSSDMRSIMSRTETPRPDFSTHTSYNDEDARTTSEQRQAELRDKIDKEIKIKIGSENLLEALNSKSAKQSKDQKFRVEQELNASNRKLAQLKLDLEAESLRGKATQNNEGSRLSYLFRGPPGRPPSRQALMDGESEEPEAETESPTYVLAEILQALEAEGMPPGHYVNNANKLVDLFKRHPTLKYDLTWSIFGLRIQTILLSDSREVVAAGYRMMRTAITDRKSLQTIRSLHTDYLVILSLVKENKANVEREQALKFVRAFLDVKDGVLEISRAIVRILVAIAEQGEDKLRNISILTLSEILVLDPTLVVSAGGIGTLTDALGDGSYHSAQSLSSAFLYLVDVPSRRQFLKSGQELTMPFTAFTESPVGHVHEGRLKSNAKVIATLLKSWQGLITLSMNDFLAIRSLMSSLYIPIEEVRDVLLDLLINILGIRPPSWGSSYLAGRRLTTYARVPNLKIQAAAGASAAPVADSDDRMDLVEHFTAVVLGSLLHAGLLEALLYAEEDPLSELLKRKVTLVLGEVLRLSNELLPSSWSYKLQVLPNLLKTATSFRQEVRFVATGTIYQVDSVNRTLYRSTSTAVHHSRPTIGVPGKSKSSETAKAQWGPNMDEATFRGLLLNTEVLQSTKYTKWKWTYVQQIVEGPLLNPKRLEEATKGMKWVQRLLSFYQPFKRRFCDVRNTKPNQRYTRIGCALLTTLLQNPEGIKMLAESKLIRQLGECLSIYDRASGLSSTDPLFTPERMMDTLDAGYFALLGTLTKDEKGIQILERWRYFNILYHLVEVPGRDDLVMTLLNNLDYTLDTHCRILLSKSMTSCSKEVRIFSTRLLRKYATQTLSSTSDDVSSSTAEWAIKLLATQLYDPEIEVSEAAVKILEEASNQKHSLEYIVKCRPSLDHLGEIGAPLLLRFLSTSVGYHYLDGLDYISREMDDWFLGRNDSYVQTVEASLQRAMSDFSEKSNPKMPTTGVDETLEVQDYGLVPTHFYRELARTKEGCRLLEEKGHFDEFVTTIRDYEMGDDDAETIIKVKGCLWAVGNVGSMELGAPFLEKSDIIKDIVKIAEECTVMSLRGTAVFVLGLISRSLHGQEILYEYGWDGTVNIRGESMGLCVPLQFDKLFSVGTLFSCYTKTSATSGGTTNSEVLDPDPITSRILRLVTDLGNTVLAKRAAGDLHTIKAKKPPQFQDAEVFKKVMRILERHHFRLPVCRFVIDLFDRRVLRKVVLEEDDDDSSEVSPISPTESRARTLTESSTGTRGSAKFSARGEIGSDSDDDDGG